MHSRAIQTDEYSVSNRGPAWILRSAIKTYLQKKSFILITLGEIPVDETQKRRNATDLEGKGF